MSKYKFNLLGPSAPADYRFVKKGERYLGDDYWWYSDNQLNKIYTQYKDYISVAKISSKDWPQFYQNIGDSHINYYAGWIRKIEK